MASAIADVNSTHFCLVGRFLKFLPGDKSPYQKLLLAAVAAADFTTETEIAPSAQALLTYQILLGKNLRRMMYRYLEPQDWVKVVGKQVINRRSGQIEWKAAEIAKLLPSQIEQLADEAIFCKRDVAISTGDVAIASESSHLPKSASASKPIRVLICQASGCRQRGSLAVSQAMAETIAATRTGAIDQSTKVTIQSTGCMKRCKTGPNVVMLPGESYCQVTPEAGQRLIQKTIGSESSAKVGTPVGTPPVINANFPL